MIFTLILALYIIIEKYNPFGMKYWAFFINKGGIAYGIQTSYGASYTYFICFPEKGVNGKWQINGKY